MALQRQMRGVNCGLIVTKIYTLTDGQTHNISAQKSIFPKPNPLKLSHLKEGVMKYLPWEFCGEYIDRNIAIRLSLLGSSPR